MPDTSSRDRRAGSRQTLMDLEVPSFVAQAVAPWRIERAAMWRSGGLRLDLASKRARIPVVIELAGEGRPLAMAILDRRVSPERGGSFVRALGTRLEQVAALRPWLRRMRALCETLVGAGPVEGADDLLASLVEIWRSWPARDGDPSRPVAALPASLDDSGLPRSARAALCLHRFAEGGIIEALAAWEALPSPEERPGFVELHLDAVALGILGRRRDALDKLARAAEVAGDLATAWLALARAHEALDDREGALRAHARVLELRGEPWDRLRMARVRRDFAPGEAIPRPKPEASLDERASFVREAVKVLDAAGRYDDALVVIRELLDGEGRGEEPPPVDLCLRAAHLHMWRLEAEQARACLGLLPPGEAATQAEARLIEGALAVIEGRVDEGLARLEALEADGSIALEALIWQAEARLALGDIDGALERVDRHIIRENTLVAYLLKLHLLARAEARRVAGSAEGAPADDEDGAAPVDSLGDSMGSSTFLDGLVRDVLPSLCGPRQLASARESPAALARVLRELLDEMGGNRSPHPTWRRGDDGSVRLEPVVVRPSGREAAVDNLVRIRSASLHEVLDGFAEVSARYPESPHPWTYRGELLIWLGRYDEALASFDEADARAPTRWSYVGRSAAYDLLGEADRADHWSREGIARFGELESATTHVYRGERMRRLGRWDEARRDLEIAVGHKPRRVGARINLALVLGATGEDQAWAREIARIAEDAPAFLWEAGVRPDRPVDEAALVASLDLMVGNRSSFLHTMLEPSQSEAPGTDPQGEFRVVPEPRRWIAHARLSLAHGRRELSREIVARWMSATLAARRDGG